MTVFSTESELMNMGMPAELATRLGYTSTTRTESIPFPVQFPSTRCGEATLVGGTVTVANTSITAKSIVLMSRKTTGGTLGHLNFSVSAGVSFTITSSSGTETSVISYVIIERP